MKLVAESLNEYSKFQKQSPQAKHAYERMPDITRIEGDKSVAKRYEVLLQTAAQYRKDPQALKNEIIKIIEDPTTHVSLHLMRQYKTDLSRLHSFNELTRYITNVYMAGAKMKLT